MRPDDGTWRKIKPEPGEGYCGVDRSQLNSCRRGVGGDRIHQIEDWRRRPFPPSTVNIYLKVIERFFNGLCPCCGETRILSPKGGRLPILEVDHFRGCQWNKTTDGWPICDQCHKDLTHGYLSRDGWVLQAFRAFQLRVNQYLSRMNGGKQVTLF